MTKISHFYQTAPFLKWYRAKRDLGPVFTRSTKMCLVSCPTLPMSIKVSQIAEHTLKWLWKQNWTHLRQFMVDIVESMASSNFDHRCPIPWKKSRTPLFRHKFCCLIISCSTLFDHKTKTKPHKNILGTDLKTQQVVFQDTKRIRVISLLKNFWLRSELDHIISDCG